MMASNPAAAARYTPGSWLGVVRSGTVVLLRPDSAAALVESVWQLLATSPQVHEVLDAVTAASGGSLARLPWFAIVDSRSSLQFFLRGEIDLTVDLPSGPVELSGRDVTTWTERRFATAAGFRLTVPEAEAEAAGAPGARLDLPLTDGVVLLQGLRVEFAGPAATDEVLAAAEADIAAEQRDHGASAETVLEFPGEDLELDGTLHEEPELEPEPEPEPVEAAAGPEPELEPDDDAAAPEPEPELELEPVNDAAGPEPESSAPRLSLATEPAEQELTGSYDHLWEQTVMRNIEDAAVREDPDGDGEPVSEPASKAAGASAGDPASGPASREPSGADAPPVPAETAQVPAGPASAPEPPAAPRPAVPTGLIDSVPWRTGTG
ncbi:MAG TPA: hypothetical protein VF867_07620, partial [Arthrobacter sp.]